MTGFLLLVFSACSGNENIIPPTVSPSPIVEEITTPVKSATQEVLPTRTSSPTSTLTPSPSATATETPTFTPTTLADAAGIPEPLPVGSDTLLGAYYWISWTNGEPLTHYMHWEDRIYKPLLGTYDSTDTTVIN